MNTLIIFGSPRQNGRTKEIVDMMYALIKGDREIIDCYDLLHKQKIAPCSDCRHCFTERACSIKDYMVDIYDKIDNAQNIIMSSPIYFNSVSAPMKIIIDRCQMYFAAKMRNEEVLITKKLMSILIGGSLFYEDQFIHAHAVLKRVSEDIGAKYIGGIAFLNSDKEAPKEFDDIKKIALDYSDILNDEK